MEQKRRKTDERNLRKHYMFGTILGLLKVCCEPQIVIIPILIIKKALFFANTFLEA